jgi:membrane associated rhomboid family serine protease
MAPPPSLLDSPWPPAAASAAGGALAAALLLSAASRARGGAAALPAGAGPVLAIVAVQSALCGAFLHLEPRSAAWRRWFLSRGVLTPAALRRGGWPGALLAHAFFHLDALHLAVNAQALCSWGPRAAAALGPARFLALFCGAGVAGGAAHLVFCAAGLAAARALRGAGSGGGGGGGGAGSMRALTEHAASAATAGVVGASAAVAGVVAFAVATGPQHEEVGVGPFGILRVPAPLFPAGFVALSLALALLTPAAERSPRVAHAAHAGGALAGIAAAAMWRGRGAGSGGSGSVLGRGGSGAVARAGSGAGAGVGVSSSLWGTPPRPPRFHGSGVSGYASARP